MTPQFNRVVVTGMGLVTPAGRSVPQFLQSIYGGKSGIKTIREFDTSKYRTHLAATVEDFDPGDLVSGKERGRLDRGAQMGLVAADLALKDAGLLRDGIVEHNNDVAVIVGIGTGSIHAIEKVYDESFTHHRAYSLGLPMAMCHSTAAHISIKFAL